MLAGCKTLEITSTPYTTAAATTTTPTATRAEKGRPVAASVPLPPPAGPAQSGSVFDPGPTLFEAKLRAQIDRRCLYATAGDERSLCVDKGIEINRKVKGLQARRAKAANAVERYDRMIAWCASYKNWFC